MGTNSKIAKPRIDGRTDSALRPLAITAAINPYTAGSAEVRLGNTLLLITAGITEHGPDEKHGRIATSIQLLPHAMTAGNSPAQARQIEPHELRSIEQLCNRALELSLGAANLGNYSINLDCTIACADGGVATAVISGGWVALFQALRSASTRGQITQEIKIVRTAAIDVGVIGPRILVDLVGPETSLTAFSSTFVFDAQKNLIAAVGQADKHPIPPTTFAQMLAAATGSLDSILKEQERAARQLG